MPYKYECAVPVVYKRYKINKEIEFSDEIRSQFALFFQYIDKLRKLDYQDENGKLQIEALIKDLSDRYAVLRSRYLKPVVLQKYKYKTIAYTQEEVEFIFQCSYKLIEKFGLSQDKVSAVFGIKPNKFSKLGCFPMRCYQAYVKLDDKSARKSLVPDDVESEGIRIAECINKNVQAIYGCSAFVGISNMLDVFANVSSTDAKAYVLTRPAECNKNNVITKCLAYPRFLFATANNLENDTDTEPRRYMAGKIKEQIIDFLNMKENGVLMYSDICKRMLSNGDVDKQFISSGNQDEFKRDLNLYRNQIQCLADIENGSYGAWYFEEPAVRKEYGIGISEVDFDICDIDAISNYLSESSQRLYRKLVRRLTFVKLSKYNAEIFKDYKVALSTMLAEKYKLFSGYRSGICTSLNDDEKVQIASIFWILEVLGLDKTKETVRNNVLKYLKTKKLLGYVDAMNKEVKRGGETHLYFEDDNFEVQKILSKVKAKNSFQPTLLYIDTSDYQLTETYLLQLLKKDNVVLVVRDTVNVCEQVGLNALDKKLRLYIGVSRNGSNK